MDFIKLVALASCIALPAAWWAMHKWLENYPYRIKLSAGLLAGAVLTILAIAMLTTIYQSIKAAMANPVKNLRAD